MNRNRIIFHIDLDAFFASCEERENPQFRGKPIVVGADPNSPAGEGKGRGVVSTANYKAREFGIHSAMPISRAFRLCPEAIFLPVNGALYSRVSRSVMHILESTANKYNGEFEQAGTDEAYLDLSEENGFDINSERVSRPKAGMVVAEGDRAKAETSSRPRWGRRGKLGVNIETVAIRIKQKIYNQEKITASVGVGPNMLVAKIASDFNKPNGLTIIKPDRVQTFLDPMNVRKLPGIGPKTESALNKLNIKIIADLRKIPQSVLYEKFGEHGISLYNSARGVDDRVIAQQHETKSISEEHTFNNDTLSAGEILPVLFYLVKNVLHTAKLANYQSFKTITLKIRYFDFKTRTKARSDNYDLDNPDNIEKIALKLLWPFIASNKKIRLIGFRISRFF